MNPPDWWGSTFTSPHLAGWRSNMARVARNHAAAVARARKDDLRKAREHFARMQEVLDTKGKKK